MIGIDRKTVERLKQEYRKGSRVELIYMNDPYVTIPAGAKGIVTGVDDIGTIHVTWDGYGELGVAYGEDSCRKL